MTKSTLLFINWAIFILLIFCSWLIINLQVSAFYHPNSLLSPYSSAIAKIWIISLVTSFFLSTGLSLFSNSVSLQSMQKTTITVYGFLIILAIIVIILVKPVPKYFIHIVGEQKYQVPREFTSIQNSQSGMRLDICLENLKGIYDYSRGNCKYKYVSFSALPINKVAYVDVPLFFDTSEEFDINDGDQVIFLEGSEQYLVQTTNGISSYTIENVIKKSDLDDNIEQAKSFDVSTHFQVDSRDILVRFVRCREFRYRDITRNFCTHYVKTALAVLQYEIEGATDFNPENWQKTDHKLLNLISQWKID